MKSAVYLLLWCSSLSGLASTKADSLIIHTSDLGKFWKSYDEFWKDTTANPFERYLKEGSLGLKDFIHGRINSAVALKKRVKKEKAYYDNIRKVQPDLLWLHKEVNKRYAKLKELYPGAVAPDVYLVIGRINSGGTSGESGIIIGMETFADDEVETTTGRKSLSTNLLPSLLLHEIIHFQQKDYGGADTVLKLCLQEGGADFITVLLGGEEIKLANGKGVYEYGDEHENELTKLFLSEANKTDYSQWLYNDGKASGRPANLGYWMGYQICASYYQRATDKSKAIYDLLHIINDQQFLKASGYIQNVQP